MEGRSGDKKKSPRRKPGPPPTPPSSSSSASRGDSEDAPPPLVPDLRPRTVASEEDAPHSTTPSPQQQPSSSSSVELNVFREQWRKELQQQNRRPEKQKEKEKVGEEEEDAEEGAKRQRREEAVREREKKLREREAREARYRFPERKDKHLPDFLLRPPKRVLNADASSSAAAASSADKSNALGMWIPCQPLLPQKPMHVSHLPDEVLLVIFRFLDPSSLEKAALACKHWLIVSREPVLWRSFCLSLWKRCKREIWDQYGSSWRSMWLTRPRIRFDGLFVSRNQYVRPGATEFTYCQPVHLVKYFRYFRFFPDGTVYYTMSLDGPRKALKWFHPPAPSSSSLHHQHPHHQPHHHQPSDIQPQQRLVHTGKWSLDDVNGKVELWIMKEPRRSHCYHFVMANHVKKGGAVIRLLVEQFVMHALPPPPSQQTQIRTFQQLQQQLMQQLDGGGGDDLLEFSAGSVMNFRFYKVPPHMLDPQLHVSPAQQQQ
ncbi:HIVEP zinc finger 3b [Balamuthia mandrillaris]